MNGLGGIPPPLSGSGASRVHSTTPLGSGSPEATPRVKGSVEKLGAPVCAWDDNWPVMARPENAAAPSRKSRRLTAYCFIDGCMFFISYFLPAIYLYLFNHKEHACTSGRTEPANHRAPMLPVVRFLV